jgi:hypothetical protein
MSAIASHKMQRLLSGCSSSPKKEVGACAVFLMITWLMALIFGIVANLSIETFEEVMNVTALAGLAVVCAALWRFSGRYGAGSDDNALSRELRPDAVSEESGLDRMPKKAGSSSTWGDDPIIGFLNE